MRILVVGGGAREHALVWKLTGERAVTEVVCAPGNPGIVRLARCLPLDLTDPAVALALAARELIDLTIVGPELPLDRGIADRFAAERRPLVGPTRAAARLECSKAFAKNFMSRHRVPTAAYRICDTFAEVMAVLDEERFGYPLVLKADGLAAGKGVVIAGDRAQAEEAARAALLEGRFGDAGRPLVVEECLQGPEISFFVLCDGRRALPLGSAQDHKRLGDGDTGPNTGGMGAFAPSPIWSPELERQVMREVIEPVLGGLAAEGSPYRGFLYVGLMLTAAGPRVIEFNVRLGDPEAQVLLPLLAGDLAPALLGAATGELPAQPLGLGSEPHVGVVVASAGYPGGVGAARPIAGLEEAERVPGVLIFHAGTSSDGAEVRTAGGRVLTVVGRGSDYAQAIRTAYDGVSRIRFEGMQYRRDIGKKAVGSEQWAVGDGPLAFRPRSSAARAE